MLDGGEVFDLFPEAGRGFTGHPALEVHRDEGDFVTQLAIVGGRRAREALRSAGGPPAGVEVDAHGHDGC